MITRRMQLDVSKPGSQLALYARQGDTRVYDVRVSLCEQSVPISVPGDWTAVLQAKKPDGTKICDLAAVEDGQIRAYFGTQAFTAAGVMRCELYVFDKTNGQALYSPSFDIHIEAPALPDSDIESSDSFGALMTAMQTVDAYDATLRGLIADTEQVKDAALTAAGIADTAASGAAAAGQEALDAGARADGSAAKIDGMTVAATKVPPGGAPTAAISEEDGHKHVTFGLVTGDQGPKGEPGYGMDIRGTYATVEALAAAVPSPEQGWMYNVGTEPPYSIYMWDTTLTPPDWRELGQLTAPPTVHVGDTAPTGGETVWVKPGAPSAGTTGADIPVGPGDTRTLAAAIAQLDGHTGGDIPVGPEDTRTLAAAIAQLDGHTGGDIPVGPEDTRTLAAAIDQLATGLAGKQEAITSDNAEAICGLLGLGNTAGMTLKYGGVTMTAAAGGIEEQDVTFTSPFAQRVYSVMLTMGGGNPRDNTASISGSSVTGFKCWFGNRGTAERTTTIYYLALGK